VNLKPGVSASFLWEVCSGPCTLVTGQNLARFQDLASPFQGRRPPTRWSPPSWLQRRRNNARSRFCPGRRCRRACAAEVRATSREEDFSAAHPARCPQTSAIGHLRGSNRASGSSAVAQARAERMLHSAPQPRRQFTVEGQSRSKGQARFDARNWPGHCRFGPHFAS